MRIDKTNNVYSIYNKNMSVKGNERKEGSKKDEIKISEQGKGYQFALNKVKNLPEIRQDKVDDLKARIEAGEYSVSSQDIANKMVNDANLHKLLW